MSIISLFTSINPPLPPLTDGAVTEHFLLPSFVESCTVIHETLCYTAVCLLIVTMNTP